MKNKISIVVATITIALMSINSIPAQAESGTKEFANCMDAVDLGAFKNTQWAACYEAEFKRQDIELNKVYQKMQKSSSPELKQALANGQKAWILYRDSWCSYEEMAPFAPGGSVNKAACLVDVTILQINRLKSSSNE